MTLGRALYRTVRSVTDKNHLSLPLVAGVGEQDNYEQCTKKKIRVLGYRDQFQPVRIY